MQEAPALFSYRKYWAHIFGTATQLPMSRVEMDDLGWDSCDIILVTVVLILLTPALEWP